MEVTLAALLHENDEHKRSVRSVDVIVHIHSVKSINRDGNLRLGDLDSSRCFHDL